MTFLSLILPNFNDPLYNRYGIDIPLEYPKVNKVSKKRTRIQVKSELLKSMVDVKLKNKISEEAIKTFKILENLEKTI